MNRPRNRQPRPARGGQNSSRGRRGGGNQQGGHSNNPHSRPYSPVPSIEQVVVGSSVSIVLKQDQPTGREVQGVVQDLLTRGNHPRGIKVRLSDGRVGRVQRMVGDGTAPKLTVTQPNARDISTADSSRNDSDGPPPRTLADYIRFPSPDEEAETTTRGNEMGFTTATATCPICGSFEGDEIAVSRHAEEHFT